MKVAILHGGNDLYGASRVLLGEIQCFLEMGHSVVLVVPTDGPLGGELATMGDRVDVVVEPSLSVLRKSRPQDVLRLPRLPIAVEESDFVVLWTLALAAYVPVLRFRRMNFYLSVHELFEGRLGTFLIRRLVSPGKFPVAACSHATASWLQRSGVSADRIRTMYPVYDPVAQIPRVDVPHNEKLRVAVVGRVNGTKGHLEVAQAFSTELLANSKWQLNLYGSPFPGQERALDELMNVVKNDNRISYHGQVSSFESISVGVDLVASFPNRPESFGLVPLEAWRAGVPTVGYDFGGAAEVLRIVGGVAVPRVTGSPDEIARALTTAGERIQRRRIGASVSEVNALFSKSSRVAVIRDIMGLSRYSKS